MSRTNAFSINQFKLIFQNIALANIGDGSGLQPSATTGNLYLALYTTVPSKSTSGTESTYSGYLRIALIRSAAKWTVGSSEPIQVINASDVDFPQSTSSETVKGVGLLTASSGGDLLYFATFASNLAVISGTTPTISAGQIKFTDV